MLQAPGAEVLAEVERARRGGGSLEVVTAAWVDECSRVRVDGLGHSAAPTSDQAHKRRSKKTPPRGKGELNQIRLLVNEPRPTPPRARGCACQYVETALK